MLRTSQVIQIRRDNRVFKQCQSFSVKVSIHVSLKRCKCTHTQEGIENINEIVSKLLEDNIIP